MASALHWLDVLHLHVYLFRMQAAAFADFLLPMLRLSPDERATAAEMLRHPWLEGGDDAAGGDVAARGNQSAGGARSRERSPGSSRRSRSASSSRSASHTRSRSHCYSRSRSTKRTRYSSEGSKWGSWAHSRDRPRWGGHHSGWEPRNGYNSRRW